MPFHGLRYAIPTLLLTTALNAQTPPPAQVSTQYWLSAGVGYGYLWNDQTFLAETGRSMNLAASMQHGVLVASVRSVRHQSDGSSGWDLGLTAGAGTPSRYAFSGSIGAGLGLASDARGNTGVTIPVELQLGWRLTSSFGLGTYVFGNIGGPSQSLGAAAVIRVGKLR